MTMIARWWRSFDYRYVGTVEGISHLTREDGTTTGLERRCYWTLKENGRGRRKATLIGPKSFSPYTARMEAQVEAWKCGGPLPEMTGKINPHPQRENPKKPKLTVVDFNSEKSKGGE